MAIYTAYASAALVATSTKSIILLNPVSTKMTLTHIDISMDGNAAAAGVAFELYRVTTLGSAAGTAFTPRKTFDGDGAATVTALTNLTVEPTTVDPLQSWFLQPFGGCLPLDAVLDREFSAPAAGARLGIRYVNPTGGTTCNYRVGLFWSE